MSRQNTLIEKHIWVIRLRYLISAVLAGSFIIRLPLHSILDMSFSIPMLTLAATVTVIVAANILWSVLLKRKDISSDKIGYYQCIFDLIVVSLLVHQFGAAGPAGYLFVLVIFAAGLLLPKRGIIIIAAISSLLYLLLLLMELYAISVPYEMKLIDFNDVQLLGEEELQMVGLLPKNIQFLVEVTIKVFFFYLVAFSSANIQELISKTQRESEFLAAFNKEIVDSVPVGVMVLDVEKNIVLMNPFIERAALLSQEEVLGKKIDDVFLGLDSSWFSAIDKVLETCEELHLLGCILPLKNNREIRLNAVISPMKVEGQVIGTICLLQTGSHLR